MSNQFHPSAYGILEDRYLLKDANGKVVEEIDDLPSRIALGVAMDLDDVKVYEEMIRGGRFLPNSPTIANAGRGAENEEVLKWLKAKKAGETLMPMPKRGGQLSACFVLPVYDDLEKIFDAIKWAARIHQTAGGTGFNFSRLRHEGSIVQTSGGRASGPISFMSIFDKATGELKAGGFRRGANMGVLSVRHKDIRKFISCKEDTSKITNFNISAAVDDEFMMKALDESLTPEQRRYELWNFDKNEPLRDADGNVMTEDAKEIYDLIAEQAHKTGEPGLLFWDTIVRGNPLGDAAPIEATNPCGEQPLPKYGSCVLGSHNMVAYVLADRSDFDWDLLGDDVKAAYRFLDDVIDANEYILPEIHEAAMRDRRTGLGIMAWAHALVMLGIPYNSPAAFCLADKLMGFIEEKCLEEGERLGHERGSFEIFAESVYPEMGYTEMRNGTSRTIAPTGTIATLLGVSNGLEPMYALAYTRNVVGGQPIYVIEPLFLDALKKEGIYSEELIQKVVDNHGSCQGIDEIPPHIQQLFVTAHDITPEDHVRMQTTFQKHVDAAISKTINMSEDATVDDVKKVYAHAWRDGAKGVTVYRNNCRPMQTLQIGVKKEESSADDQRMAIVLSLLQELAGEPDPEVIAAAVLKSLDAGKVHIEASKPMNSVISLKDLTECPVCGTPTIHQDKCTSCPDPECGWSACGIA